MSLQRARPINTLQKIMSSFKHFEKKLDKLQEDVNCHGHTLSDLRVMLANLSAGSLMSPDIPNHIIKRSFNNTAIQYDDRFHMEETGKIKRKKPIQPIPSKITAKSMQNQKIENKPTKESPYRTNKLPSIPKITGKHVRRRKAEAPRKATTLRTQKALEKKLINVEN